MDKNFFKDLVMFVLGHDHGGLNQRKELVIIHEAYVLRPQCLDSPKIMSVFIINTYAFPKFFI